MPVRTPNELAREALDKLLALFDRTDRRRAAEKYEDMRLALLHFFEQRRSAVADALVDEVLDRVARKLDEGTQIDWPRAYFYGVAKNVFSEYRDRPEAKWIPLEVLPSRQQPRFHPQEVQEHARLKEERDRRFACMQQCVQRLQPETLTLLKEYSAGRGHARIERREALAREHEVSLANLRTRICRIRIELNTCVAACVEGTVERDIQSPASH